MPDQTVVVETSKGLVRMVLDVEGAPVTAGNFLDLARQGFYDGLRFHRYVAGFVIQGGDPAGNGSGGSGRTIKLETTSRYKHDSAGTVAMARTSQPDSASSQFYITLAPAPFLDRENAQDGLGYAAFGKVSEGLDVVEQLREGDRIERITVSEAGASEGA
ncbi:MAG: peptidylprolyl isomerase [Chthonomonadales bacterium]|nr:peptidylprolyl isomerase [Chthonomonadales bacterium]